MNDAERDAWLHEALRHAPDSGALPPRGVSEAILAEARAIARQGQARRRRASEATPRHPLAAFWDWLARPPVAVGFASLMAATLIGLMWWDRPLDETLPRRPDGVGESATTTAARDAGAAASAQPAVPFAKEEPGAAVNAAPAAAEPGAAGALADAAAPRHQLRTEPAEAARSNGKNAPQAADEKRSVDDALAKKSAAHTEQKAAKPSPFPAADGERAAAAARPEVAAREDREAAVAQAADAAAQSGAATAAKSVVEPAAAPVPSEAARARELPEPSTPPAARRAEQQDRRTPAANDRELDAAKNAPAAAAARLQPSAPAARSGALADARERQASAFAAQSTAQARNDLAAAPRADGGANAAPLASILGAFASEPARWSRKAADGSAVALEAGWRDWLTQLDAAARGRWQRVEIDGATVADRDGATTVRLLASGRPDAVVRLDGTTARVDGGSAGERWQATLPAVAAERLRSAGERLPR
jgi:hypothetical protein